MNRQQLLEALNKLEAWSSSEHGKDFLVICPECFEQVYCLKCEAPCKCWNDE